MGFLAETGSGHALVMDGAPDAGKPETRRQPGAPADGNRTGGHRRLHRL